MTDVLPLKAAQREAMHC